MNQSNATEDKDPLRVLFLCTGNSCRSQMAEGWARHLFADEVEAYSAGTDPTQVNPKAVKVMREAGVDISSQRSKSLDEFIDREFDLVVTLCDDAQAQCPVFPGVAKRIHLGLSDPAQAAGSEEDIIGVFREVRDRIRSELVALLERELQNHKTKN